MIGDQQLGCRGIEFQQGHRALVGELRHQLRPAGDHLQALGRCQRAGHNRGGDLTHRMTDDRIGFHTMGAPECSQCQLHAEQHRLDPH